jgi:hypothetical protein
MSRRFITDYRDLAHLDLGFNCLGRPLALAGISSDRVTDCIQPHRNSICV